MCSKSIISFIALCLSISASGQLFQQVYTTESVDFLQSVQQMEDNGYLLTGFTNGAGEGANDALIVRTGPFGDILWSKTYGSTASESFPISALAGNGNVLVGGSTQHTSESGIPDAFVSWVDASGDLLWTTVLGGLNDDKVRGIEVLPSGEILVVGLTNSYSENNSYDIFLSKLNDSGEVLWSRVYGTPMYDVPLALKASESGEIFIWGHQEGDQTLGYDACLIKLNAEGEILWNNRYSLAENELAWDMDFLPNGDLIISGDTNSAGEGLNDIFVLRMNQDGTIVWSKTFGGFSHDHGTNIKWVQNDMFVVGGAGGSLGAGGLDFLNVWINMLGEIKYSSAYGGNNKEVMHGMTVTNDFGLAQVGETRTFGQGAYSGLFVKTDQDGRCACNNAYSSYLVANDVTFNITSAGFGIISESIHNHSEDFLEVADNAVINEVLCTSGPGESNLNSGSNQGVNDVAHEIYSKMKLYPNPANGPVKANIKTKMGFTSHLQVFDLEGSIVYQKDLEGSNAVQSFFLPDLSTGIYLVRLTTGDRIETKKLIVE